MGQAQFIKIRLFALAPPKNRALLSMQILLKIAMSSAQNRNEQCELLTIIDSMEVKIKIGEIEYT